MYELVFINGFPTTEDNYIICTNKLFYVNLGALQFIWG